MHKCASAARTEIRMAREQASNNQHHLQGNVLFKKPKKNPEFHARDHGCGLAAHMVTCTSRPRACCSAFCLCECFDEEK
jgi:hypothetical protein